MANVRAKVIEFIENFQIAYPGVSPSYREILEGVGRTSTGSLGAVIEKMVYNGELEKYDAGSSRGIILPNTVLLTREMVEQMGLDWYKLKTFQSIARSKVKPKTVPPVYTNGTRKVTA